MINFIKMQGLGNDYVYIDCTKNAIDTGDMSDLASFVSNRHFGIGSDGLILICKSKVADFKMRIFNYDGSEAEMCGNGIRCVGKFVYDKGLTTKREISVETLAGIKKLYLSVENGKVTQVTVDMGEPILEAKSIPVISEEQVVKNLKIKAKDKNLIFSCVSMGNPHAITVVEDIESFEVAKYGEIIEKDEKFPRRTNVEFIQIINDEKIKMRVWERGAGETLACGTGACASVVSCILNKRTKNKVQVELLGGNLLIEWNKENNHVYMTGPAEIVFEGEIEYGKY